MHIVLSTNSKKVHNCKSIEDIIIHKITVWLIHLFIGRKKMIEYWTFACALNEIIHNRIKVFIKSHFDFYNILSCSRHWTTKFPNSECPIFTTKFLFWFFWWFWEHILRLLCDLERIRKGCVISIYKLQNVSSYCLIKQVNKILGIRNSEIWLFDDVSKINRIKKKSELFTK